MSISAIRSSPGLALSYSQTAVVMMQGVFFFFEVWEYQWIKSQPFFSRWCYSVWVIWGFVPKWVQWFWQNATNFVTLLSVGWERNRHLFSAQGGFQVWDYPAVHSALRWQSRSSLLAMARSGELLAIVAANFQSPSGRPAFCTYSSLWNEGGLSSCPWEVSVFLEGAKFGAKLPLCLLAIGAKIH